MPVSGSALMSPDCKAMRALPTGSTTISALARTCSHLRCVCTGAVPTYLWRTRCYISLACRLGVSGVVSCRERAMAAVHCLWPNIIWAHPSPCSRGAGASLPASILNTTHSSDSRIFQFPWPVSYLLSRAGRFTNPCSFPGLQRSSADSTGRGSGISG